MRRLSGVALLITAGSCLLLAVMSHIVAVSTHHWIESAHAVSAQHNSNTDDDSKAGHEVGGGDGGTFLNLGLWQACFHQYQHIHEHPSRTYNGCHSLYSQHYYNIRIWLIPGWLWSCRVTAVIGLVLHTLCLVSFIILVVSISCPAHRLPLKEPLCQRVLLYTTPLSSILAGVFVMATLTVFADNAFRLQCKDFWVSGEDPNSNRLGYSWAFEFIACICSYVSAAFIVWLVVLRAREDI